VTQKKSLIIDIGKEKVWAGVIAGVSPDKRAFLTAEIPPGEGGLKAALAAVLTEAGVKKGGEFQRVLVSVPAEDLSIRIVDMPFSERKKVLEALPFELAGLLHVEVDEVVTDAVPLGEGRFLAVAVERRLISAYLELFKSLGVDPVWVGSGLFAIPALMGDYGKEGVRALLFPGAMAVTEGGSPRFFKPVRRLDGVRLGAAFLDAEGLDVDEVHYAGWDEAELSGIFHGARLIPLGLPVGCSYDWALIWALALIDGKGLLGETVNFRRGEFEYTRDKVTLRKGLKLAASLAALLAILLTGDLYIRYLGLSAELDSYRQSLRASYLELFPGERNVTDPVYQLEARLKAIQKEGEALGMGRSALDALNGVAQAAPQGQGIRITELTLAEDGRVIAKGEVSNFEAASSLKEAFARGRFRDVSLDETRARPEGGASFSINAYLR